MGKIFRAVFIHAKIDRISEVMTTKEAKNYVERLQKQLDNAQRIIDFDRVVYSAMYSDEAVDTVQKLCEYMPDINTENCNEYRIQSMLNIAYDKGFEDCILMVCRYLDRLGVFSDEISFS